MAEPTIAEHGIDPLLIFLREIADPDNWEHVGESAWRWIGYPPFEQATNLVTEAKQLRQRENVLTNLAQAIRAYDRALATYGSQIDIAEAPVTIQSEDLDVLYEKVLIALAQAEQP